MAEAVAEKLNLESVATLIAATNVAILGGDELARLVVDAERLLNAANALSAVALEEFERRGTWTADGSLSAASWAAARTGTPPKILRARIRAGAGLRLLPSAAPAARAGRLSPAHLAALAGCVRRHPALAARDEELLVEQAEQLDADSFRVLTRRWEERADAVDGPDPATVPTPQPVDELHLSKTFEGRYQLNGTFSTETGQLIHAALEGEVDRSLRARRDGDPSVAPTASAARAAALVDLVSQTMRREPSDASVPDRYRVAVVVRTTTPASCRWPVATHPLSEWSSAPTAKCSISAGRRNSGPPPSAERSQFATAAACSPVATGLHRGATFTIAHRGNRAEQPASPTEPCSAEDITASFTGRAGRSLLRTVSR